MLIQVVSILVITFAGILSFLQLSSVQTYLGRLLANDITKKTGFHIIIGKVDINWLDRVNFEAVEIIDLSQHKMISVEKLQLNYSLSSLRNNNKIELDQVVLDQAYVHLNLDDSIALNITEFIALLKDAYATKNSKKPKPFIIQNIEIINGKFAYNHIGRNVLEDRFDYNHFGFDSIYANAHMLVVVADTFMLTIDQLRSKETSSQLPIKSLATAFQMSKYQMKFDKLSMEVGNSIIKDSLVFNYNHITDLNNFVDKVLINAHFEHLKLSTQDLKYFSPYFKDIEDTIIFTGNIKGGINDFVAQDFSARFGKKSNLNGDAYFEGLPDVFNTFIDLKFKNSKIHKKDLSIYIPSKEFDKYSPIDSASVKGSFTGYPKDFVANATFNTSIGYAQTDLNLKIDKDPSKSSYSGSLKLIDFDIGKATNSSNIIGHTTMTGKIRGTGFTQTSADFILESSINKIDINQYNYQNISTNAHFANELFEGSINVDDENLKFVTDGIIDFRNKRNKIELKGELIKAQLNELHIRKDSSSISAQFDININGISLDSITGKIVVKNVLATNNNYSYKTNQFELLSELDNTNRKLILTSDRVNIKLEGDFNFTDAVNDFKNIWLEHKIKFLNQETNIDNFYSNIKRSNKNSNINFDLQLKNINPLLNLFDPSIYVSQNSQISGHLTIDSSSDLKIEFTNDTISYDHNLLINNVFKLNTTSNYKNKDLLVSLNFDSEHQKLRSKSSLDSLSVSGLWKNNLLDFNLQVSQEQSNNIGDIEGRILFKTDTTELSIIESKIEVLNQPWNIDKENKITFIKNQILLSKIRIVSGSQELFASGTISRSTNDPITIISTNIDMGNLNPLLSNKLEGLLNGSAEISNVFTNPLIESEFRIESFKVDGYSFGNIDGKSNWNQQNELFDINLFVEKNSNKLVNITGTYLPLGDDNSLNLNAKLIGTDLKLLEPFSKGLFSNISGEISGNVLIAGPLFEPRLSGSGNINDASLTVDYLKATFKTEGVWHMDSTSLTLSELDIEDNNNGKGNLEAKFSHKNFKNFDMDLKASFQNLIVLNTISKDNNYFYGKAVGSGDLSITGPIANLVITTRVKTEKGTKFYIPLSKNKGSAKQEDFITFSNFTQQTEEVIATIEEEVNLRNITVNLDIEITPEAYAEIIFDLTAGDIIRGRGNGHLSLGIDTKGEFTLLGDYKFIEGGYNFTMYNIVNKEFKINPNSKISWSGDPYLGKMDIDAMYEVNTSLSPIMDTIYHDLPEVKRIYPSKVLLDLNGLLLSPDINFDIIIEDYPKSNVNIDTEVRAFLNKIHNDEQEMNRQVFSLLVFRKFSPPNSFSTGGTVGSSVSEFVSNQLSYLISQVDDNLTIDFDLGDLDENALQTFQLRVSYAFMDGKLIVTRDGGFTDQNQQATLSSITGDWTVEYLISKDGKVRIKLFKRTNYDQLSSSTNTNDELISGGFSLLYTTSFESIKELFEKDRSAKPKKNKKEQKTNDAIKPEEEANTP